MKPKKQLLASIALLCLASLFIFNSCKKENNASEEPTPVEPAPATVELWDNVYIIDSTKLIVDTVLSNFANGIYAFNNVTIVDSIKAGDVIVGSTGEGYIRKIISVLYNGNQITMQTTQGNLEDVFKEGDFNFSVDMNDMHPGEKSSAFTYSINNYNLYQNGPFSLDLNSANLSLNPVWLFKFSFGLNGIKYFEMSTANSSYAADAKVSVSAGQAITLVNQTATLAKYTKTIYRVVMFGFIPVPVVVKLNIRWLVDYSATIDATASDTAEFATNGSLSLGMKYQNQQWQGIYNFNPTTTINVQKPTGSAVATLNCGFRTLITAKIDGVEGPHASVGLMTDLIGTVASPSLDWDIKADAWLQTKVGANVTMLGYNLANYPDQVWNSSTLTYRRPYQVEVTSGDNQFGQVNQALPNPIKVRVRDSKGLPVTDVPVYFNVTTGGGFVNSSNILTDQNGFAETLWTLGSSATQNLSVGAKFGDLSPLNNAPLIFTANISVTCPATVTDVEGNVYDVVQIGNQCWMQENLRTAHYNSGVPITLITDSGLWDNDTLGAWCYPSNNSQFDIPYGKLYNWFVTEDPAGLCPSGWHVPDSAEFNVLTNYLGGSGGAGGMIKEAGTSHWSQPNAFATNSSSLTALPAGIRYINGTFTNPGFYSHWWCSNYSYPGNTFNFFMSHLQGSATLNSYYKSAGFSVRCLKD